MNQTLYPQYVDSFFPKLQTIIEKINGKRTPPKYFFKERLRTEYSADQKWNSASVNTNYVAADIVSLDSPLPLKSRPTFAVASGTLPKVGMKMEKNESQINAINIMIAQNLPSARIIQKLIADADICASGIDELNEYNFLKALADGQILVKDENAAAGTGLRISFNYLPENCFGVETKDTLELSDLKRVIEKADSDGNTIAEIWIAKTAYDKLRQTRAAKELVATFSGMSFTDATTLPVPTATKFNEAFADDNNGIAFVVVDRSVKIEKDGKITSVKAWSANKVVFTIGGQMGALVYGSTAESTNNVAGVNYTTIDGYKLISEYSKNEPLREITSSQALVLPVIENVDEIYTLDITEGQVLNETAETTDSADNYVTIWGNKYTKTAFISAMKAQGISINTNATDANIIKKVNELSDDDEAKLKKAVESAKVG